MSIGLLCPGDGMDELLKTQRLAERAQNGPLRAMMETGPSLGYLIDNKEDGI